MRTLSAAALAVLFSLTAQSKAQTGRAMTIDDLITAVRVTDPQLSPDGSRVIFVRTTTDPKTGDRNADIWSVPADGSGPAQELIGGNKTDNTPRFSPDGKSIAFISTRDGAPEVYLADAKGGSVKRITNLSMGVQPPLVFSPDGSRIAFVSDVYPECADEACNKRLSDEAEKNPVKVHRLTRLLYPTLGRMARERAASRVRRRRRRASGDRRDARRLRFAARAAGRRRRSRFRPMAGRSPSSRIARAATAKPGRRITTSGPCRSAGGDGEEDHDRTPPSDLQPLYSPDGRTLFVRAQRRPGFESDRWYLDAYDRSTAAQAHGVRRRPTSRWPTYALSPDGATIWFTAAQQGREDLFTVPSAGGTPTLRRHRAAARSAPQSRCIGFAIFSKSHADRAGRNLPRRRRRQSRSNALTHENASWLKDVAFSAAREPDGDGRRRHAGSVLADQAAELRCVEEVSGRVPDSRRSAGQLGRRVVVRAGIRRCGRRRDGSSPRQTRAARSASARSSSTRSRSDWGGKVMTDIDAVVRRGGEAAVTRLAARRDRRRELRRLCGGLDPRPHEPVQGGRDARRRVQPRIDGLATEELWFTDWEFGGAPWTPKARAQFAKWSPHLFANNIKTPTLIITNEHDYPRAGRSGAADVHGAAPQWRAERSARVSGRGPLGAEGAQQPRVARGGLCLDEEIP